MTTISANNEGATVHLTFEDLEYLQLAMQNASQTEERQYSITSSLGYYFASDEHSKNMKRFDNMLEYFRNLYMDNIE